MSYIWYPSKRLDTNWPKNKKQKTKNLERKVYSCIINWVETSLTTRSCQQLNYYVACNLWPPFNIRPWHPLMTVYWGSISGHGGPQHKQLIIWRCFRCWLWTLQPFDMTMVMVSMYIHTYTHTHTHTQIYSLYIVTY